MTPTTRHAEYVRGALLSERDAEEISVIRAKARKDAKIAKDAKGGDDDNN